MNDRASDWLTDPPNRSIRNVQGNLGQLVTYMSVNSDSAGASQESVLPALPASQVTAGLSSTFEAFEPENRAGFATVAALPETENGGNDAVWGLSGQAAREATSALGTALLAGNLRSRGKRGSIAVLAILAHSNTVKGPAKRQPQKGQARRVRAVEKTFISVKRWNITITARTTFLNRIPDIICISIHK